MDTLGKDSHDLDQMTAIPGGHAVIKSMQACPRVLFSTAVYWLLQATKNFLPSGTPKAPPQRSSGQDLMQWHDMAFEQVECFDFP